MKLNIYTIFVVSVLLLVVASQLGACRKSPDAGLNTPSADEPFANLHSDIVR